MPLADNGTNTTMLVQPSGYGCNTGCDGTFGGNGAWWLLVLFLFAFNGNGWGNGFGGNNGAIPYMMNNNTNNDVQRGFDQQAVMSGLGDISGNVINGFAGVNQALCSGFAGVNATVNNGFASAEAANNSRQMANMNQMFALQTGITNGLNTIAANQQNCCCENRAAIADVKYTIATENCQDRYEAANNTKDILATQNANTNAIITALNQGFQTVQDKLCQQELDALKAQNLALQNQLNMATVRESNTAMKADLIANNDLQTAALKQYFNPTAIPAYVVQNPNCCAGNYYNSGCGCNVA